LTGTYMAKLKRQYTNTQLPLGREAQEAFSAYSVAVGVTYNW